MNKDSMNDTAVMIARTITMVFIFFIYHNHIKKSIVISCSQQLYPIKNSNHMNPFSFLFHWTYILPQCQILHIIQTTKRTKYTSRDYNWLFHF